MGVWETEDESPGPVGSLPTPIDTPYRTPSRNVSRGSRKSRRSTTPTGKKNKSRSPPPENGDKAERGSKRSSRDVSTDEHISLLDPRRFTPTLHASLVSEILSLRRDQEEKLKLIESLESSLQAVREESESLQASLVTTGKETRSLKRQLALLEGGTSSALGDLARERDDAVESVSETKKRLELTQKKLRSQEEDSERVHRQWAKEKDEWEEEKRKFERRVHVAESRLKVVLDEVAAFQGSDISEPNGGVNGPNGSTKTRNSPESDGEDSGKENDAASVRTMSLTNSIRFSMASGGIPRPNGNSLADELGFDGFDDESDYGGRDSVLSNGHRDSILSNGHRDSIISNGANHFRNMSRDSILSRTHIRRQSNDSLMRSASIRGRLVFSPTALERLEDGVIREDDETEPVAPKVKYVDTGVQFSPPPSPKIVPAKPATPERSPFLQRYEKLYDVDSPPRADLEIEANQRRKRVQIGQPLAIKSAGVDSSLMVNSSSQTIEAPLSPPKTPKTPLLESPPTPKSKAPEMVSVCIQTDDIPPPLQPPFVGPIPIPSISIIPPSSRPGTPREPRLPQLSRDFGCQVSLIRSPPTTSTSMQTEEIRVDKRLAKLPPHLHPSAITSRPSSPAIAPVEATADDSRQFTPVPGNVPPRNPRRLTHKQSLTELPSSPPIPSRVFDEYVHDTYPGNNDDGPVSSQTAAVRRPHRISSLFAGFDGNSSDEVDEFMDPDMSDSEYRTALSAPKPIMGSVRGGKRASEEIPTSPEQSFSPPRISRRYSPREMDEPEGFGSVNIISQTREARDLSFRRSDSQRGGRSSAFGTKSSVMRKSAMIQSGIASHSRARSPSLADPKEPPFPIPTRASSRKPPLSASAPSDGRTTPSKAGDVWLRRGSSRSHYRANSIRKVRSAAAMPRAQKPRRRSSRSPPSISQSIQVPESPGLPPLPSNEITTSRNKDTSAYSKYRSHRSQPSTNTATTGETGATAAASQAGSSQSVTVVEAIAQTMVGEWMFKYVRRRKSFGVADSKIGDDSSNDRHKRWVWLAPYERSILWSSKQPVSGSALLGKSGRKLTIQSVLDVKDDNPLPKGAGPLFDRSILILTPQRALKFTATNADRHYIWITALSFLAHSNQSIPETLPVAPQKPLPEQYELPKTKVRRPIRDSIRLTKAKTGGALIKSDPVMEEPSEMDSAPPSIPTHKNPIPEGFNVHTHAREESLDPAQPPAIQRRHGQNSAAVHGRKRSNTGNHVAPPLSFRGFSGPAASLYQAPTNSTARNSIAGSSDIYSNAGASGVTGLSATTWATSSVRTSEASTRPSGPNFFDAIGTVRMEAFISPLAFSRFDETPFERDHDYDRDSFTYSARRRSKEIRRKASRSRQRDSYHSRGTRGTDELDDWYNRDDPFRGF